MTNTSVKRASAVLLLALLPATALAGPRQTGTPNRPAAPPAASNGFNFNRDIAPSRNPNPAPMPPERRVLPQPSLQVPVAQPRPAMQRPVAQPPPALQRPVTQPQPAYQQPSGPGRRYIPEEPGAQQAPPRTFVHAPPSNGSGGPFHGRFHGPIVRNPRVPYRPWEWNRGVAWHPAPIYWGGGFWGPFALATLTDALLVGAIIDYDNHTIYPSYQVEPDTPGADLLNDYGLAQTQCGPPNLVVIWGPDNSVICAVPNDMVAPGNYEVDPSTFTLVPESP